MLECSGDSEQVKGEWVKTKDWFFRTYEAEMETKGPRFDSVIVVERNGPVPHVLLPLTCFKCPFLQIGIKATHIKLPRTATESEVSNRLIRGQLKCWILSGFGVSGILGVGTLATGRTSRNFFLHRLTLPPEYLCKHLRSKWCRPRVWRLCTPCLLARCRVLQIPCSVR